MRLFGAAGSSLFSEFDADGDKSLKPADVKAMLAAMGYKVRARLPALHCTARSIPDAG